MRLEDTELHSFYYSSLCLTSDDGDKLALLALGGQRRGVLLRHAQGQVTCRGSVARGDLSGNCVPLSLPQDEEAACEQNENGNADARADACADGGGA